MTYDQWKTESPYDDEIDWAEYGAKCPACGSDQFEVVSSDADSMELDLECNDCSKAFIFPIPGSLQSQDEAPEQPDIMDETSSGLTYDDFEIFEGN